MRRAQHQFSLHCSALVSRWRVLKERSWISGGILALGLAVTASAAPGLGLGFSCPAKPPEWGQVIQITGTSMKVFGRRKAAFHPPADCGPCQQKLPLLESKNR